MKTFLSLLFNAPLNDPPYSSYRILRSLLYLILSALMFGGLSGCDSAQNDLSTPPIDMETEPEALEHVWEIEESFGEEGTVMSVWGAPVDSEWSGAPVWAVGGQPERGRLWTRQDEVWRESVTPSGPLLNWVHGAAGHLWIVGNEGRALRRVDSVVGGSDVWEEVETGISQDLWGVWVSAPDEVWAVGGNPLATDEPDPILIRFNGIEWERISLPELDRGGVRALFKIYGDRARGEVFAVGMKGVIIGDTGAGWTQRQVEAAAGSPPSAEDFVSLWRTESGFVAVGGRSNGVIARWDGARWSAAIQSGVPGLNGVWVDPSDRATAVGVRGVALTLSGDSLSGVRERTQTALVLHAVWGRGDELWAVGGSLDNSPPWEGVILRSIH